VEFRWTFTGVAPKNCQNDFNYINNNV
jgi:hypothetical protein